MKISRTLSRRSAVVFSMALGLTLAGLISVQSAAAAESGDKVPLNIKLPSPAFKGTPKDIQLSSYVEPLSDKPRPPMMVPAGLKNLASGAKLTSSDANATPETLAKI